MTQNSLKLFVRTFRSFSLIFAIHSIHSFNSFSQSLQIFLVIVFHYKNIFVLSEIFSRHIWQFISFAAQDKQAQWPQPKQQSIRLSLQMLHLKSNDWLSNALAFFAIGSGGSSGSDGSSGSETKGTFVKSNSKWKLGKQHGNSSRHHLVIFHFRENWDNSRRLRPDDTVGTILYNMDC